MTAVLGVVSPSPGAAIASDRLSMIDRTPSRPLDAILKLDLLMACFMRAAYLHLQPELEK